jgi:threonine synthase
MTIEGKKTVSLEIYRQLNRVPDQIFVPVGDGCILAGVYKGFRDLKQLGITRHIPEIIAVQSEKSNAIALAFENRGAFFKIRASSIADSLNVDIPRNGHLAVHNLMEYGGRCVIVGEKDILEAQALLSANAGMFTEPASATAFAGYLAIQETIPKESLTVVLATGNGLKDISSATRGVALPNETIESLEDIPNISLLEL